MHYWHDSWFEAYGDELYKAERYISDYVYTWSRCRLMSKEKYGTIRYEHIFPPYGGYYVRPNWIDSFLSIFGKKTITYEVDGNTRSYTTQRYQWHETYLFRIWLRLGKAVLRKAIKNAVILFPNVAKEITEDYEDGEYL